MPVNKNAQVRYQALDQCFSDFQHKYFFDNLLNEVNAQLQKFNGGDPMISVRQLREDIKAIRKMLPEGIHLEVKPYYDKKCYYRYSEQNFSLYQSQLSEEDVNKIGSTIEVLRRYRGLPHFVWIEEVISNLEFRFGFKSNSENVVSFEQNERLAGLNYLSQVIDAVMSHTPLNILYRTYRGREVNTIVHPYHVKQYNNRWFLFGYEEETERIVNKALDRIKLISNARFTFRPNRDIDFAHYFDDVVGVSVPYEDIEKETIVLRFTEARFPYVTSKPIHGSQTILDENDCTITLQVKPNRELEQQILSFGPDVEVLSPESFRNQIGEKIKENFNKYFPVQKDCTDEK